MTEWAEPLFSAEEMRAAEEAHEETTLELMERAGSATAAALLRDYTDVRSFSVWCGTGSNGGDGFVVARKLREAGREVALLLLGSEDKVAGDAAENLRRAKELGLAPTEDPKPAEVLVDALFGTGFSGRPRREAAGWIEALNAAPAPVVSVDVPSGVDASTARVQGPAVEAERTVTFHGLKVGLAVGPGRFHAGEVEVADLGLTAAETRHQLVTERILQEVPRRGPRDNKYTAGHVVVVGGSTGLAGAPSLTAEAAMRAGAGYVRVCAPDALASILAERLVEVTLTPSPCDAEGRLNAEAAETILAAGEKAHAVVLGPGLGRSDGTRELVRVLLDALEIPVVLDGDGLWALIDHLDWVFSRHAPTVLTPHSGELASLLGQDSSWVDANRLEAAQGGSDDVGAVVVLKGSDSIVAAPGRGVLVCDLGNPGLASAGTGDVLAGITGAFLAKGMEARLAAAAGVAAGGVAAREAAKRHGTAGMIARDVIESLSPVLSS